jgi:hypothetical protein
MMLLPTCQEVEAHLTDFTEGTLPWRARLGIRLHLLMCHSCAAFLRGFQVLPALARRLLRPAGSPPPEALQALKEARKRLDSR